MDMPVPRNEKGAKHLPSPTVSLGWPMPPTVLLISLGRVQGKEGVAQQEIRGCSSGLAPNEMSETAGPHHVHPRCIRSTFIPSEAV